MPAREMRTSWSDGCGLDISQTIECGSVHFFIETTYDAQGELILLIFDEVGELNLDGSLLQGSTG